MEHFFAAGRSVTARQNGLALAGDFMSAAAFLGNSGLIALYGYDGFIYCVGGIVGWPIVMVLVAEALRKLGRYTFVDVVASRLRQPSVRISAALGSLTVILFYLTVQMVGAGNLIRYLFGLSYEFAVVVVGAVLLAAVLFGGMIATTWVQIVKAVLLLTGATTLGVLALARFGYSPPAMFAAAAATYGSQVLAPGGLLSDPLDAISLGLALMLGTAGLPAHPDALLHGPGCQDRPRVGGVCHGTHRVLLSAHVRARLRCDGDRRAGADHRRRSGRQHGRSAARRAGGWPGVHGLHLGRRVLDDPGGGGRPHAGRRRDLVARPLGQRDPQGSRDRTRAARRRAGGGGGHFRARRFCSASRSRDRTSATW